jgi:hypothetical protein
MLNNFLKENSTKSKLNILWKVRQALGSVRKPLMSGDFVIFRPNVKEILNFE